MKNKLFSISAIICTKDRKNDLAKLIESLHMQTVLPDEIIIIDASKDNTTYVLIKEKCNNKNYSLKYIRSNPGLTYQRNIGIKESNGCLLLFLDDDVVLDKKFIKVIIETFKSLQGYNIGGISGRITNIKTQTSKIDSLLKKIFFLTDIGEGKIKLSGVPEHRTDNRLALVNVLTGCCMVFQRKIFDYFSFDEMLTGYSYMEDTDFSYRVSKTYKLLYQPHAKLQHFASTYRTSDSRKLRGMLAENHFYLFRKNQRNDIPHIFAFILSIIGLFIYNLILLKDMNACRGIAEALLKNIGLIK